VAKKRGVYKIMSFKAASAWGSILVVIALIITLLKNIIAFVGFLTTAIQILLVVAFIGVFGLVGYLIFKAWSNNKRTKD
jgi:hypothetical protein